MSFFDWDGLTTKTFTGLANYIKLFQDRIFWTSFRNSFLVAGVLIVFEVILGTFLTNQPCIPAIKLCIERLVL